ncbi:MAG: FKBP-type peptidyl-prolyl cis-trans isomerase N-terminal domain-containing protein [Rhodanobacter sp.]
MEKAMTPRCGLLLGLWLLGGVSYAQAPAHVDAADKTKLSYAIGYQIGSQFSHGKPEVDIATLQRAIQDAYAKRPPTVSMQDMHQQLQQLDQRMHADSLAAFEHLAQANAEKSAQYMMHNRARAGVVQLPSGIQYAVIEAGSGKAHPTVTSTVVVNYRGMLVDGTEFDSTRPGIMHALITWHGHVERFAPRHPVVNPLHQYLPVGQSRLLRGLCAYR